MSHTTRTVTLSLALLLASTSLASAGFIWLAPEGTPAQSGETVYSRQADPAPVEGEAAAPQTQGRAWTVDPAVPVEGAVVAPLAEAAPAQAPVEAAVATAPVTAPITLQSQTMAAQPVYSPGDQMPTAPTDLAVAAPAVVAPAPQVSPVTGEVTLATSRDMPQAAPAEMPSISTMPTAESMISSMPSMTAPRPAAPAPQVAEVAAPVVTAPPVVAPEAPATAPIVMADTAAPVAPVTAPAAEVAPAGVTVSPITGETVPLASYVPPAAPTDKVVDGFGKQVPLVIAMRQILPSEYSFAHGDGVDLSQSVSWEGGKPWQQVLNDAIRPIGLTAQLTGDTVMLNKRPVEMAPELTPPAANVVAPAVTSRPAPGAAAVLTNATIMQTPPSN